MGEVKKKRASPTRHALSPGELIEITDATYACTYDNMQLSPEKDGILSWIFSGMNVDMEPESINIIIAIAEPKVFGNDQRIAALVVTPDTVGWIVSWKMTTVRL